LLGGLLLLVLLVPMVAACGGDGAATQPEVVRETVVVTAEPADPEVVRETVVVEITPEDGAEPTAAEAEPWTTPHPILGDQNVRQAIAYCANRPELIRSVYPFLTEEEQQALLMDTFLPQGHWALAPQDQITTYPFDPERGIELLEESGWTLEEGDTRRLNADGDPLSLKFTTTNAAFRETWAAVFEQQLLQNCGIEIIRTHAPGSWWFGATTGLQRRDFELGAYAWVGEADPGGETLYACSQIPLPSNNWEGQNFMGWCNEEASEAIFRATNSLSRTERIEQYGIVQREFTADMVSLPLFNRFEAAAASNNLLNFRPNATADSEVVNIDEWELADGGDTVIIGLTQEPETLFLNNVAASVANTAGSLTMVRGVTTYDYDYQAAALEELPTIENGGTTDEVVEVSAGDEVWTTDGEAVALEEGVRVLSADGEIVTFEGEPIEMRQLSVTFEWPEGLTWEDGEPVTAEDMELAYTVQCDPESGAVSYTLCNSIESVDFTSDTSYTINYLPGARWSEYFALSLGTYSNLFTVGAYPAHRVLSDGRTLADVPPSEWSTLAEVAEDPYSYGPYMLVSWEKGQRMIFEANPNYYKGEPVIKTVIIQFFEDTNQAVAQLLNGEIDVLGTETLGAGPELETVLDAGAAGNIQVFPLSSPTWEHIDMNLFIR
jgi:ABC-type transport system substrate-binding protein